MEDIYIRNSKIMNALSIPIRLQIISVISNKELCASEILNIFSVSQPTMSYHMKILVDANIVNVRNVGKYTFYSLNYECLNSFVIEFKDMINK